MERLSDPVSLTERAGIDVMLLPDEPALVFGEGVITPAAERRSARDLVSVLRDPDVASEVDILYAAYRGITPRETAGLIAARGLVYVALVLRAGTVGRELTRTRGHLNNTAHSTPVAYPEIHEIWNGRALLYLQKRAAPNPEDICVMPLAPGETAVVAPGWASLLVNIGVEPLAVGTWRTSDCIPQHADLEALGGMAHYVVADRTDDGYTFEPNRRYSNSVPTPRKVMPRPLTDFGLGRGQPMLTTFRRNPDFLRFLLRPQDYADVWADPYPAENAE